MPQTLRRLAAERSASPVGRWLPHDATGEPEDPCKGQKSACLPEMHLWALRRILTEEFPFFLFAGSRKKGQRVLPSSRTVWLLKC